MTTAQEIRLQLAALESEARSHGAKFKWRVEERSADRLNPDIFPRGFTYFDTDLEVSGGNFLSGISSIRKESELAAIPAQARQLMREYTDYRACRRSTTPGQGSLALFDDPPADDDEADEEEDDPADTPDPWELDTAPESCGLTCLEICTAYIAYLFHGDDPGAMTPEEIALCDTFSRKWRVINTARYRNGEPYTNEFNRCPDLSLHGFACETAGVWCAPIEPQTPAA